MRRRENNDIKTSRGDQLFIAYLRNLIRIRPVSRKVEPPAPVAREFDPPPPQPPVAIVELEFQDPVSHAPEASPAPKHKLSIWV